MLNWPFISFISKKFKSNHIIILFNVKKNDISINVYQSMIHYQINIKMLELQKRLRILRLFHVSFLHDLMTKKSERNQIY